jgi:nucleotide-binding universal stress UspA family protein
MSQKKILVAIDGSEHSHLIVDKAIAYARLFDVTILLVYCHRKFPSILGQPYRDEEISAIMNESEKVISPFLKRIKDAELAVEERVMEEPAGAVISDIARIEKCELIIMGSRGLTNLKGLIIGSVTNRVLQTAPCSVLVVR